MYVCMHVLRMFRPRYRALACVTKAVWVWPATIMVKGVYIYVLLLLSPPPLLQRIHCSQDGDVVCGSTVVSILYNGGVLSQVLTTGTWQKGGTKKGRNNKCSMR